MAKPRRRIGDAAGDCHRRVTMLRICALILLSALVGLAVLPMHAIAQVSPTTNYTTSGNYTYTIPAGIYFVSVRAAGAGGGGGGSDLAGAGGNGGTGSAITIVMRVTPGQIMSLIVGGGGRTGFTGGFVTPCVGGGTASTFGSGGKGADANCASGGYSGGGGAGGGGSSAALAGTVVVQAGGGGGGSGGGWNNLGANGVAGAATLSQTSACGTLGTGTPGVVVNLDGGAAGGGGGGFPGGTSGAGSGDDSSASGTVGATGGGTKRGGGGGGNCANTVSAVLSASMSGTGGAGAAGNTVASGSSPGTVGAGGSVVITLLPSVIVTKTSNGGVGTFNFTGTNGAPAQSLTTVTAGTNIAGSPQLLTSPAAQTVISEAANPDYSLTAIGCANLGSGGTAAVDLAARTVTLNAAAISPGVAVICTFTNAIGLSVRKVSTVVWDPVNGSTNPKFIPGAEVRYCISMLNNAASPAATSTTVTDTLPAGVTFVAGSSFINGTVNGSGVCNTGAFVNGGNTTAATGAGSSGTTGGSFSGGTVTGALATINSGETRTLYFDAIVN